MINIVCVLRKGGKVGYDSSWVEKLKNMISRNLTLPYKFICLSDCDVPCERIPLDDVGPGYWAKIQLFKPNALTGPTLFLDLDTVICQNIDNIVLRLIEQKSFIMWRDTKYNISSSAIMFWNGDYSNIYTTYIKDPDHYHRKYSEGISKGDQAMINDMVRHSYINEILPDGWLHVIEKNEIDVNFNNIKILIFRKYHTKPSTLSNYPLVKEHWK